MRHRILAALCRAIEGEPVEDARLPDPWLAWLVVCLLRQVGRQRWMLQVLHERLRDSRDGERGRVPGLDGWRYEFHGIGCCLSSEEESIDVDFHERADSTVDPYFFANRVRGLRNPGFPERRLRSLLPTDDSIALAIDELRKLGGVGHPESQQIFRLAPELQALERKLPEGRFEDWCQALGDFEGAQGHARAAAARARRLGSLHGLLDGPRSQQAIEVLQLELSDEELVVAAEKVLQAGPGSGAGAAIQALARRPKARISEAVPRLLRTLRPGEDHPFAAFEACSYLLLRGVETVLARQAVLAFGRTTKAPGYGGNPFVADFAMLAIEFVPEHALELVRGGLASAVPLARTRITAALLLLDKAWTSRELVKAGVGPGARQDAMIRMEMERLGEWAERVRPGVPDALPS